MNKYEEYSEKIKDIEYILSSKYIDIIDYQYILTLIYESIYIISQDLITEIKTVLNKIDINIDNANNEILLNINDSKTYIYLLNLIRNELNQYNLITDNTKKNIINILNLIDNSIGLMDNININININQSNQSSKNEICINDCKNCSNNCNDNSNSVTLNNDSFDEIVKSNLIFENKYLNKNYIKDYYLNMQKIKNECAICGLTEWQNNYLTLKLDFIDGNYNNQELNNIRLLCPNCFSQVGYE